MQRDPKFVNNPEKVAKAKRGLRRDVQVIANVFAVRELEPANLRTGLADLLGVAAEAVDVADRDGDQEDAALGRTGPVHLPRPAARRSGTGTRSLRRGRDGRHPHGGGSRARARGPDGHVGPLPAQDLGLDSAFWVAVPDGRTVRCRLETIDSDEDTTYRVDAVEEPVADLPRATVESLPEVLDAEPVATPSPTPSCVRIRRERRRAWRDVSTTACGCGERLVRRLAAGWSPSGRYREDLFLRDLRARDDLARLVTEVDAGHAERLRATVARLDEEFRDCTEPGGHPSTERWWRDRNPRSVPW
ncbi:hypothetical protein ACRAWF_05945 [Streptomyces sp. L7]